MPPAFDHTDKSTWLSAKEPRPLQAIISPSILASDFARLADECKDVLSPEGGACEWLHVDVMDGHFVPNISIGPCVVSALRKHFPHTFLDVHCMITSPEMWIDEMAKAGASGMTFHVEAAEKVTAVEIAERIRAAGMQVGISVKPKTPVSAIKDLLDANLIDLVLVMTVEPGFGGQSFMNDQMPKVAELRKAYPHINIEVDGGLGKDTIEPAAAAGANVIVAGTSVFKAQSRKEVVEYMRDIVQTHIAKNQQA